MNRLGPGLGGLLWALVGVALIAGSAGQAGAATSATAADRVLFDVVGDPSTPTSPDWVPTDAVLSRAEDGRTNAALRVDTGTRERWPGVALKAPAGGWDLTPHAFLEFSLRNPGTNAVKVFARVDNPGADGRQHCVTGDLPLGAGAAGVLRVELRRTSGGTLEGKLFGMRGYPQSPLGDGTIDPARVTQVLLFVQEPKIGYSFEVRTVRATGIHVRPTAWTTDADPYFPFIDGFGQYRHRTWPGKIGNGAELEAERAREAKELAARPSPPGWDRYGGWADGPKLEATGFFRVQKHEGRWWLVDPDGFLFWSHGVDCVRSFDATVIAGREEWFEGLREPSNDLAAFFRDQGRVLKGHYAGQSPRALAHAGANYQRKYGTEWRGISAEVTHQRLRSWGMNTIANWSDREVARLRRTPYTDSVQSGGGRMVEGSEGYWGKFPDVFDPGFAAGLRRGMAGRRGGSAGDPWCLGYFSDNEMSWGDDVSLALAALQSPADQPAKRAMVEDLRAKYGEVARLNAAWGTAHASWELLLEHREPPDRIRAESDLAAFYTRTAETYFRTVRDAIREAAPRQLYLGCRFAWVNARAAAVAARFCDVVSYNLYQRSIADFRFNGGADVPLIIGEFHFGALDRGMFHTGLVPVPDQAARARAYTEYVEGALRHPQFVGAHWFQWQDEPTTGRVLDEENYQIGLVDIVDTPYAETVAAVRSVGERMYRLRLGGSR